MSKAHNKKLLSSFEAYLYLNFKNYCIRHGIENNNKNFITYLIDKDLFNVATIKRYTVLEEFERLYPKHQSHKRKAVEHVADLFSLSSRHVWSLLKYGEQMKKELNKNV